MRNGIELRPSNKIKIKDDDGLLTLEISDIEEKDAGAITCEIKNKAGKETCSAPLDVIGEFFFIKIVFVHNEK